MLFRRHALPTLVPVSHWLTVCGIGTFGLALVGVVLLIFSFVISPGVGLVAAAVATVMFCGLCLLAVLLWLRHRPSSKPGQSRLGLQPVTSPVEGVHRHARGRVHGSRDADSTPVASAVRDRS